MEDQQWSDKPKICTNTDELKDYDSTRWVDCYEYVSITINQCMSLQLSQLEENDQE